MRRNCVVYMERGEQRYLFEKFASIEEAQEFCSRHNYCFVDEFGMEWELIIK